MNVYGCGGWDEQLYKFMCPVSGYYLFLFSIHSVGSGNQAGCPIYLRESGNQGSQNVLVLEYHNWENTISITASGNVILPCEGGNTVWVHTQRISSLGGDQYSQFSGILLKQGLD